ncbi:M56 family metallopeptidase [Paenibacillus arenilitoris]|uniref:M56 family metallopeptidase n=1 Tax=Paenibacillus arenilitoris TaxID=2772299 RepID=A0A927CSJ1_9BACL|nr:M56 family metallopeptidase [Paenibacillus arenilitoris]MBD2871106.1 M56 family metallopeptidase [Paenibacillus arenilitoris]
MWKRRSKALIMSSTAISLFIMIQMGMYVTEKLSGVALRNVFDHCTSLLQKIGMPWLAFAVDLLVATTPLLAVALLGNQLYLSRRAYRKLSALRNEALAADLNEAYSGGKDEILVVSHPDPIALTMGFVRPRIVLSTGLIQLLDEGELEALIRHEQFHLIHRDPLKTFLMVVCSAVIWYVPILKWSRKQYTAAREVLADAYAIDATGSAEHLGSALLKLLRNNRTKRYPFAYASFAESSINYRIKHLIDPQAEYAFRLPVKRTMLSLQVVAALSVLLIGELL